MKAPDALNADARNVLVGLEMAPLEGRVDREVTEIGPRDPCGVGRAARTVK